MTPQAKCFALSTLADSLKTSQLPQQNPIRPVLAPVERGEVRTYVVGAVAVSSTWDAYGGEVFIGCVLENTRRRNKIEQLGP